MKPYSLSKLDPDTQSKVFEAIRELSKMTVEQVDQLAFGAIELDDEGIIRSYNRAEAEITGLERDQVLGKSFFKEVAPCTMSPRFYGKFVKGIRDGETDVSFDYTFDHQMTPTRVTVHLYRRKGERSTWVAIKRL